MVIDSEKKDVIIDLIKKRYEFDFSDYSENSMLRRINRFCDIAKIDSFFDLKHYIINDKLLFERFVNEITVNVTEMFREPLFFRSLKETVFPYLDRFPSFNIWHAGCSSGEEIYSNAILLKESNLYHRSKIWGSDINPDMLDAAGKGIYPLNLVKEYSKNYSKAGGKYSLSDYYEIKYNFAEIEPALKQNIKFVKHNLVSNDSFNKFNTIICRNVIIYFNQQLQERVFQLFYNSLSMYGYLALGSKETLQFSSLKDKFEVVDKYNKIYRKIA